MTRPRCKRCGGPLDFDHLGGDNADQVEWACNNLAGEDSPATTDEQFYRLWDELPGDDVVKLERML